MFSYTIKVWGSRQWSWEEFKFLIYLNKWSRLLAKQAARTARIIVLDHGPIFKMATLHAFGPVWLRSQSANSWWEDLFNMWAATLNLIICLDAPDSFLEVRINERNQKHQVKGKTSPEVKDFLSRYRSSYDFVLSGIARANGPKVIKFNPGQVTLDQLADGTLDAISQKREASQ